MSPGWAGVLSPGIAFVLLGWGFGTTSVKVDTTHALVQGVT